MRFARRPAMVVGAVMTGIALTAPMSHADNGIGLMPLVDAMAQRLALAQSVAAVKYSTGAPVNDASREHQVLDDVAAAAVRNGVDVGSVTTLFRDQIEAAVSFEDARIADWTTHPDHVPVPSSDLADLRAQIDAVNHRIVNEVAQQQDRIRGPECPDALRDARADVAAQRAMDEPLRTALAAAARNLCQRRD